MPFIKLQFKQGVNRDQTNYTGEGGWWDGDKIRFFSGYPQKIGGWFKATSETFIGTCRQLFNYITSFTDNFLAVGTNIKVYIEVGGYFYDITPLRTTLTTSATDNCIETTSGSNVVTINVTGHGCTNGAYVTISGVTGDVGGIPDAEINTEHKITLVDANEFTITVATNATSTVASGGGTSIDIACQINPGFASVEEGYGWGTSSWGSDGWGLASSTPVSLPQRDWWFDNFENDLFMNIRSEVGTSGIVGGPIYIWERGSSSNPTTALATRAILLEDYPDAADVPEAAGQILMSQNDGHLLAFGCQPFGGSSGDYDPLLIRWASQNAPYFWTPGSITVPPADVDLSTSGFIRVSRGSKILRAIPNRQEILVFTDSSLYSLQYTGTAETFALQELGDNISIMSCRAVATANNITYWMGIDKFYVYDGRIQTLPTTLREYVFKDINLAQFDQVVAGTNEGFNEVWWFYPSKTSTWNDRYVIYNYLDNCWYYGTIVRTAWLDTSLRSNPVAIYTPDTGNVGELFNHEFGVNDGEAPIKSFIQSNDFDVGEGEQFMLTRRIIPDINFSGSTVQNPEVNIAMRPRNFPGSQFQNDPSDTQRVIESSFGVFTNQIFVRARARQMALKISSDGLGTQWQLGSPRLDSRLDGKQ